MRRYDVDALRVFAIGLLLLYHVAVAFQPWGLMIGFISHTPAWTAVWLPMTWLNVWRIPLLFFISGMGMCFSFRKRTTWLLLAERGRRIGLPLLLGYFVLAPLYLLLLQRYYDWPLQYVPHTGHLWFLGNMLVYLLLWLPVAVFLNKKPSAACCVWITRIAGSFAGIVLMLICLVMETWLIRPAIYEMYANTVHGFFLGGVAFAWGYLFAHTGDRFFILARRCRWFFLLLATGLLAHRLASWSVLPAYIAQPVETGCWVMALFGWAARYLQKPFNWLPYWSGAAYPVYVFHMVWLAVFSALLFPLQWPVPAKFLGVLAGTALGSLACYEIIRRWPYRRAKA